MRLFAEERRQGTIEALLTVPVTETEVVVAKWLAGVIMYCAVARAILPVSCRSSISRPSSISTWGRS